MHRRLELAKTNQVYPMSVIHTPPPQPKAVSPKQGVGANNYFEFSMLSQMETWSGWN